jgi:formylglycine-generating enzyme required for sulfatase activity
MYRRLAMPAGVKKFFNSRLMRFDPRKPLLVLLLFGIIPLTASGPIERSIVPPGRMTRHPYLPECARCHAPGKVLRTDFARAECAECHLPGDRLFGTYARAARNPVFPKIGKESAPKSDRPEPPGGEEIVEQEMIKIPAGPFIMGNDGRPASEGPGDLDEMPAHKVVTGEYLIDKYEVTNAHYQRFVEATRRSPPIHWRGGSYPKRKANHPVVYVSWFDAKAFCEWSGNRLPTEAEWEKGARGTDGRHFPWGNAFDPARANTPQHWLSVGLTPEKGDTMPVGSFEDGKSPYGLYDMAGNVYEWVEDWYKPYPGNRYPNRFYGERDKILRGGSWYDCLSYGCGLSAPSYNRSRFTPEIRNSGFGFRCARSVGSPAIERKTKRP